MTQVGPPRLGRFAVQFSGEGGQDEMTDDEDGDGGRFCRLEGPATGVKL